MALRSVTQSDFTLPRTPSTRTSVEGIEGALLDAISGVESSRDGYTAVNRGKIDNLTSLTIDEVIEQTFKRKGPTGRGGPGDPSTAAGRYQILNATLGDLKKSLNLDGSEIFDETMQDRLGIALLERRGLQRFLDGSLSSQAFLTNLRQEWTGINAIPDGMLKLLEEIKEGT